MENEDQAWLDYRARFAGVYDEANYAGSLQSAVMRAGHRLLEKPFKESDHFAKVLANRRRDRRTPGFCQAWL